MRRNHNRAGKAAILLLARTRDGVEGEARCGFSLVEVAMALGVVSFALLSILALLPAGLKTNQISSGETRASCILSVLEADLRNTHPSANNGNSLIYGLPLPYTQDLSIPGRPRIVQNTALSLNTVTAANSIGIKEDGQIVTKNSTPRAQYQATVIYTRLPAANSPGPMHARLVVNWPCINATASAQLTTLTSVVGYVETYVTFPMP